MSIITPFLTPQLTDVLYDGNDYVCKPFASCDSGLTMKRMKTLVEKYLDQQRWHQDALFW